MIDLSTFIQTKEIKEELEKNCVVIRSTDDADLFALEVSQGKLHNVIFEKSSLKSYTFSKIQISTPINIINCNSTLERFCESLDDRLNIFDNVNLCKNIDILNILINKKGILVC